MMDYVAVDIETKDPHLKIWGPGSIRRDGCILGVGMYSPGLNISGYFDPKKDREFISMIMNDPQVTKIFHNGVYDLDWLCNGEDQFTWQGRIEDTMTRETLLDAYALSYSLDNCCIRHGLVGKNKGETIDEWWKQVGGKGKAVEHLDEVPRAVVAKYCVQDCKATYDLFVAQQPMLEEQKLLGINDIEAAVYPWLMETRKNGMIIDWKARTVLSDQLNDELDGLTRDFKTKWGDININSANDLARIWKHEGLPIEYTEKGKPSFTAAILEDCDAPVAHQIKRMRMLKKLLGTFVDGQFVDLSYNGRLYPSLYPAKRSDAGTVTGRFSSQNPNGQNIPARGDKFGSEIRSLFIPEDGCLLGAFDFKQIEYRIFTHFASGPGAAEAKQRFVNNPNTDYHQLTVDLMGWGDMPEGRHLAKNFNFGSIYGLSARSFAVKFKQNLIQAHPDADPDNLYPLAKMLMDEYYRKVTFVKPTCKAIENTAIKRGYVKTLGGRHQRLTPDGKVYKIVNYLIQGSAGDVFKKGVCVDAWKSGVWNVLKSHMMVHDESVFSIPQTKEGYEACEELYRCMINGFKLTIPLGVDTEIGPDWGHCTMDNWNDFKNKFKEA